MPLSLYTMRARQMLAALEASIATAADEAAIDQSVQSALAELHATAFRPIFKCPKLEPDKVRSVRPFDLAAVTSGLDLEAILFSIDELGDSLVEYFNHTQAVTNRQAAAIKSIESIINNIRLTSQYTKDLYIIHNEFQDTLQFDTSMVQGARAYISTKEGILTLARASSNDMSKKLKIRNVATNGEAGNYHLIEPLEFSYPDSSFVSQYSYLSEREPHDDPSMILDSRPDTWFECQMINISDEDKESVGGYDFEWAQGDSTGDTLRLRLALELPEANTVNWIAITPYIPDQAYSAPIVRKILVSEDGLEYKSIYADQESLDTELGIVPVGQQAFDTKAAGAGVWTFPGKLTRYIDILIDQPRAYPTNVGHTYYMRGTIDSLGRETLVRVSSEQIPQDIRDKAPGRYKLSETVFIDKNIESFPGWRYAIGIRDIYLGGYNYSSKSEFVSAAYPTPGPLTQIALDIKEHIPSEMLQDLTKRYNYARYYLDFNDSGKWNEISPLHHYALGEEELPPKTILINSNLPQELHNLSALYLDSIQDVNRIRLKIVLSRLTTDQTLTPTVDYYTIKAIYGGGS